MKYWYFYLHKLGHVEKDGLDKLCLWLCEGHTEEAEAVAVPQIV